MSVFHWIIVDIQLIRIIICTQHNHIRLWSKRLKFIRQVSESRDSAVNLKILSIENVLTRQAAMIPTVGPATTTLCTIHMNLLGSGNKRGQSNKPISASHYQAGFQNSVTIISHQPLLPLQLPIDNIASLLKSVIHYLIHKEVQKQACKKYMDQI